MTRSRSQSGRSAPTYDARTGRTVGNRADHRRRPASAGSASASARSVDWGIAARHESWRGAVRATRPRQVRALKGRLSVKSKRSAFRFAPRSRARSWRGDAVGRSRSSCCPKSLARRVTWRRYNRPVFFIAVFVVAILSGATASVVGFGIGSLMTPLLAVRFGTATAVALVMLPHAVATAVRCWRLRAHVDRRVLVRFGLLSAAGALAGALHLHATWPRRSDARARRSPALDRRRPAHRLGVPLATAGTGWWRSLASCPGSSAASPAIRVVCARPP